MTGTRIDGKSHTVPTGTEKVPLSPDGYATTQEIANLASATSGVTSVDGQTGVVVLSAIYQPLDSDLTAIAALGTTAYGRAFLALADAAAGRTALGLGTAATHATGDYDAAGAAAAAQAASQPLDSDLTAIAALTTTSYGRAFLALADAAAARSALALGTAATSASTDFQPIDSDLTAIAALTTTSFGRAFLTLADAAATFAALGLDADLVTLSLPASTTISAFGASLIDDAAASNARTTLGLGTAATSNTGDFDAAGAAAAAQAASQPLDSDLTAIAALTTTSYGRALLALADAAALRTAAGLGAAALLADPITAAHGGTGLTTLTAHALQVGNGTGTVAQVGPDASSTKFLAAAGSSADHAFRAVAESDVTSLVADLALKAPLASPALTGTPTAPTQTAGDSSTAIATDAFVTTAITNAISGLDVKPDVAYAATSALPACTYANGSSGVGATLTGNANGPLLIDGVTILVAQAGSRVLVAAQAAPEQDGWYSITQVGVVAVSPFILTRATESDQAAEIGAGYLTGVVAPNGVTAGSNNGKLYVSVAADPFVVGTTALTFSQVGGTYTNGTGLSLSGSTFSIDTAVTVDKTTAQTLTNKTLTSPALTTPTGIVASDIASGTFGVARGGTGAATLAAHGVLLGNGTSAVAVTGAGTSGQVLTSNGASADPTFQAASGGTADKWGLTPTAVKTATTYTAAVGDLVRCDTTSNAITITLPTAPADGSVLGAKLIIQGGTNAVTITCGGSDVFNKAGGSTSGTITLLNEAYYFQYIATGAIWILAFTDTPATVATLDKMTGLTTTTFGRGLLDDANAAATISSLGLDADIATFALPASTTISAFGATLVDDADAATGRTTLGAGVPLATDPLWDTKGDLAVATGADAASKLVVGTVGQAVTALASETTGLIYANPRSGSDVFLARSGSIGETMSRLVAGSAAVAVNSGGLRLQAIYLPKGAVCTNIGFVSGTTPANGPTHWWFSLHDLNRVYLRSTADQTSTAWAASTEKIVNLGSSFTTTYEGLHYLGFLMTATVAVVTLAGIGAIAATVGGVPILGGNSTTGMTTPQSDGTTAGAITATAGQMYGFVS